MKSNSEMLPVHFARRKMRHATTPALNAIAIALLLITTGTAQADPVRVIVDALASHDIVLLSEEHYGVQFHGFLHQVLADGRLPGHVQDIVVESGNPLYQGIVDRYVSGHDVQLADVRPAWRNTSQILAWDSPLYEQFFVWVRTVNSSLKPDERYRVVLMEPRIDWKKVKTAEDYEPYAQRSRDQLARVESEVLAKRRKAIVVVGGSHVVRRNMRRPKETVPIENASLGDALGRKYPGRTYAVWTVPAGAALSSEFRAAPIPQIVPVRDGALASRSFGDVAPTGIMVQRLVDGQQQWVKLTSADWPPIGEMADALLILGPIRTKAEPPHSAYRDIAYYNELLRRARIMSDVFGVDMVEQVRAAAGKGIAER